jgi:hypothetical protein
VFPPTLGRFRFSSRPQNEKALSPLEAPASIQSALRERRWPRLMNENQQQQQQHMFVFCSLGGPNGGRCLERLGEAGLGCRCRVVVLHVVELLQSQLEGVGSLTAVALRADNQCSVPVVRVRVCVG